MSSTFSKTSSVWDFFDLVKTDATKAKCRLCFCVFSRGGLGKKASTTSLINHLKRKHLREYNEKTKDNDEDETLVDNPDQNRRQSQTYGIKRKQITLEEVVEKKQKWEINDPRAVTLHNAIAAMITCDNQPYSFVENEGFRNVMEKAQPRYNVPSRNFFKESVIPKLFDKCKAKLITLLNKAEAVSVTTDMWTSTINNYSFISLTGHFIHDDFTYHHAALCIRSFQSSHTAESISDVLKIMLNEWNLSDKIHLVVRDGGPNIVKALRLSSLESITCFLHTLHLVVSNALTCQRSVSDTVHASRRIVGHFNHSAQACSRLTAIQEKQLNMKKKKLVQDITTRWNSTFYMFERLLEQRNAVSLYAAEFGGINNLTPNQWMLLEKTLNLLKPFEAVTKEMSATLSFVSEVIPMVATLKLYLVKEGQGDQFSGVGTMKETLLQDLNKRLGSISDIESYYLATVLDPRFKLAFFDTSERKENVKRKVISLMEMNSRTDISSGSESEISRFGNSKKPEEPGLSLWDCFAEITNNESHTEHSENSSAKELEEYIDNPLLNRTNCPLDWWRDNKNIFPRLSDLAKRYLSAPGSSIYSERLFSEAGNVYENKRNRILPKHAETLVFLHHNLKLCD